MGYQVEYGWMHAYCPFSDSVPATGYDCLIDAPLNRRYLVSSYYIMTTMATVGYGDVTPRSAWGTFD